MHLDTFDQTRFDGRTIEVKMYRGWTVQDWLSNYHLKLSITSEHKAV
jgi:hypothetical protein